MKVKLLFQEIWEMRQAGVKTKNFWNNLVPEDIQERWNDLKKDISQLEQIRVPRCAFVKHGLPQNVEIFAFGDAFKQAYALVIYIVATHNDGSKMSHLAFAKTRVAPLKMVQLGENQQTIVRLELLAALITARSACYIQEAIERTVKVTKTTFFTDSLINLCRIRRGPSKYQLWVANRVEEILKLSSASQWHHCPGKNNPADLPSRGLTVEELATSHMWWEGPDFIKADELEWPVEAEVQILPDPEEKKNEDNGESFWKNLISSARLFPVIPDWELVCQLLTRFEDWHKTVKQVACILRIGAKQHKKFQHKEFSVEEKSCVEKRLWQLSQRHHFPNEFELLAHGQDVKSKSSLAVYNPFFDKEDCLLRSRTRLVLSGLPEATRMAIVLPRDCPIVAKFVMSKHSLHKHAGTGYMHALLKEEYLIPRGRQQIRKIIRGCTTRRCVKPTPLGQQEAPLPALRVDNPAPFSRVAVDLFGPMMVFQVWVCKLPTPRRSESTLCIVHMVSLQKCPSRACR